MAGHYLRGGFHMEGEFKGHRSPIVSVEYDAKTRTYLSLDSKCVKLWRSSQVRLARLLCCFAATGPTRMQGPVLWDDGRSPGDIS